MQAQLWNNVLAVRSKAPLVHNITNYVVMNNTANALLAVGASPIMAHAHSEIKDMISIIDALVINMGTLDEYWVKSMHMAIAQAQKINVPWVLDPVGAGATPYRNEVLKELVKLRPTIIRGNASEIISLASQQAIKSKGVDSTHQSNEAIEAAQFLSQQFGSVVCISGATDIIIQKNRIAQLSNGHAMMARVTGMGCTASALCGAFAGTLPASPFDATVSAMALLGVAGELAARQSNGPGSLQLHILDTLYSITENDFVNLLKITNE